MDRPENQGAAAADRPDHLFAKIGKLVIMPIGALLLLGALYSAWSTWTWLKTAVEAEGTVIEMVRMVSTTTVEDPHDRTKRTVASGYVYAPLVRFRSRDGAMVEFQSTLQSNPPGYVTGQTVTVLYDPKAPNSAEVSSFAAPWIGAIITAFVGSGFAAFGALFVFIGNMASRNLATVRHADPRAFWERAEAEDAAEDAREMAAEAAREMAVTPAGRP